MGYIRSDEALIQVWVNKKAYFNDVSSGGPWATYSGGALTAESQKTRPGGMGKQVSVGGPTTRGDATLTIQFTDNVAAKYQELEDQVGSTHCHCAVTFLHPYNAKPRSSGSFSRYGTLKEIQLPEGNSDTPAVSFLTLVIDCDAVGSNG